MPPTTRSDDIRTYSECRANFAAALERARETGRPTFITNHGHTAGVLLSPEAYDALAERAQLAEDLTELRAGMADIKAGKAKDFRVAMRELAAKYGLSLPQ